MMRRRSGITVLVALGIIASSCSVGPQFDTDRDDSADITIEVTDENGRTVAGAEVNVGGVMTTTADDGTATITLVEPAVATVSAPDFLREPVAIAPTDRHIDVRLWNRFDADGTRRTSLHFGGDVMLGRRYLEPDRATPFVDDAASARGVVADLAPMSASADWTSVNLETVVGDLPDDGALDAKRFLLQSTPLVTEALDEMGVDLVTLGNNHAYDWAEAGIESTLQVLDAANMPHVGAGHDEQDAARGTLVELDGLTLGVVSSTTVTGDFVNDQLPRPYDDIPDDLEDDERWQYERRPFAYSSRSGQIAVGERNMMISEVWEVIENAENYGGFTEHEELWDRATAVFPELQDWVARRGHGGAARYQRSAMTTELERLRAAGADMLIVQIHGGFQFAEVNSAFIRSVAHAAIDAGAETVIAHHPHVLQGVEWYEGKLIAYSLGNLVFDQGFASTFPSAMLRVITSGTEIVEARLLPIVLDRYRPMPVTGDAAREIIRMVDHRTALPATSARVHGLTIGSVLDSPTGRDEFTARSIGPVGSSDRAAAVLFERNSGLIVRDRSTVPLTINLKNGVPVGLPPCALTRSDDLGIGVELGVDLFAWGEFDILTARTDADDDAPRRLPVNWRVPKESWRWTLVDGASGEPFDRALQMSTDTESKTTARIAARLDLDAHRLFDTTGRPLDAAANYEILLDARRERGVNPNIRLVTFDFDDTDPNIDPQTDRLQEIELTVEVPDDGQWHQVSVPVPSELTRPPGLEQRANSLMMYLDAPPALRGDLAIDNVQFIEWRGATTSDVTTWAAADVVRSSGGQAALTLSGC